MRNLLALLCFAVAAGLSAQLSATEQNPIAHGAQASAPTGRIIVKFRSNLAEASDSERIVKLADRHALSVAQARLIAPNMHVIALRVLPSAEGERAALASLRADPMVEYAVRDELRYPHAVPTDSDYANQWFLQPPVNPPLATLISAIDAQTGWNTTTGSSGVVIAQLDTGVRFDHPDLLRAQSGGRLLPGYDFVSSDSGSSPPTFYVANDGDGWDPDPSDPGDWLSSSDLTLPVFTGGNCMISNSSWHGTRTAGILGALTNNGTGVAGVTWKSWILPVRVLGKCGGYDSDIVVGMQWAAGISIAGVPDNPFPAQIENLSLGGASACPSVYSDVIPSIVAKGVLIVASAGNEGGPVDAPANCPGVAGIAGIREAGDKVGYSSLGPQTSLSAPAGNCGQNSNGDCLYELETTFNLGLTVPAANVYTDPLSNPNLGTSFSAPLAAGTAALMLAVNGNLVSPQLIARLQEGSLTFPTTAADVTGTQPPQCQNPSGFSDASQAIECICTTAVCGAGMLNVPGALAAARRPIAAVKAPLSLSAGQMITLDAAGSAAACQHAVSAYSWSVTSGTATLSSNNAAQTSLAAPSSGSATVQLTVTDDQNLTDVVNVTITPSLATAISTSTRLAAPVAAGTHACLTNRTVTGPVASATLTASSSRIPLGTAVNLKWSAVNATGCRASNGTSSDGWIGNLPTQGPLPISEGSVGVYGYTLTCYGATVSDPSAATVTVLPTATLTASSASTQPGQMVTLTWSSMGATECSASGGSAGDGWSGAMATSGTLMVKETSAGSYTYTLSCDNAANPAVLMASVQAKLTVAAPASGGGGGGATDWLSLSGLGLLVLARARERRC